MPLVKRNKKNHPAPQNNKRLSPASKEKPVALKPLSFVEKMTALVVANKMQDAYHLLTEVKDKHPQDLREVLKAMAETLSKYKRLKPGYRFLQHVQKNYPDHLSTVLRYFGQGFIGGRHFKQAYAFLKHAKKYFPSDLKFVLNYVAYSFGVESFMPRIPHFLNSVKKAYPDRLNNSLWNIVDGLARTNQAQGKFAFQFLEYVQDNHRESLHESVKSAAYGFAVEGHLEQLGSLFVKINQHDFTPRQLTQVTAQMGKGFARLKDTSKAYLFAKALKKDHPEQLSAFFNGMVEGFFEAKRPENIGLLLAKVQNYYPQQLPDLLIHLAMLKNVENKNVVVPQEIILQTLVMTDDFEQRKELAIQFLTFFENEDALEKIFYQATDHHHLMDLYRLNYFQLQVFLHPELTTWLLHGANALWPNGRFLSTDLVKLVATFLLPSLLPGELSVASHRLTIRQGESKPVISRLLAEQGLWNSYYQQEVTRKMLVAQEESKNHHCYAVVPYRGK